MNQLTDPHVQALHHRILSELQLRAQERTRTSAGNFQPTVWIAWVWDLWPGILEGDGWFLGLLGPARSGKDFAARYAAAMRSLLDGSSWESHRAGELVTMADLFGSRDEFYELARWRGTLIISDLGREPDNDRARAYLTDLLDIRYDALLRTLVTGNLTIPELEQRYGRNCLTRMADGGWLKEEPDAPAIVAKPKPATLAEVAAHYADIEAKRKKDHEAWLERERANEVDPGDVTPEQVEELKQRIREGRVHEPIQVWEREPFSYEEQKRRLQEAAAQPQGEVSNVKAT